MALNWDTQRAIPTLKDYAAAKEWHDKVVPIRGDEGKTRPCGRRDQKWFSIWETKDAIHVGHGISADLDRRIKLVTYNKSGSIVVYNDSRYGHAATNERLSRLLDGFVATYQYDTWIKTWYYVNGAINKGWQKLIRGAPSEFVRDNQGRLVFLNYKFPVTHKVNKAAMDRAMENLSKFVTYIDGLRKLHGGRIEFEDATKREVFTTDDPRGYVSIPNLRWARPNADKTLQEVRLEFFDWARSDDHMDHLKAAVTLVNNCAWSSAYIDAIREQIICTYRDAVLTSTQHTDGKLVKDRMRRYFIWG